MTDDLVARLRDTASQGSFAAIENNRYASPHEAADRIETLEAALKYMAETKLIDDDYQEIARTALEGKTE